MRSSRSPTSLCFALGLFLLLPASATSPQASAASAAERARGLLERSEAQVQIDPESSRRLAEQALAVLGAAGTDPTGGDTDSFVRAQLLLCEHHSERSRADAERHAAAAREQLERVGRAGLRSRLLACDGEIQEAAGQSAAALSLFEQAVVAAEQARDDESLAEALFRRGNLRSLRADYATGLADLKRAHSLYLEVGKPGHATTVQNAIAILYNRMGDPAQARHYFEIALKAQVAAGLRREQIVTVHNLGRTLENLGDWGAAEHAFNQCLALSRELKFQRGQAYALRGLAGVHNARGAPAQALALLDQASALQRETPDMRLHGQIQLQRGLALHALQRLAPAAASLREALAVFEQAESPSEQLRARDALGQVLAEQADWRGAWEQARAARDIGEHVLRRQLDDRFATLKVEYDSAAREQEVSLLQREQASTAYALQQERLAGRLRSATVALGAVALTMLALLAWRQRHGKLAMRRLAMTDELTGLPNRRDVLGRLEADLRRNKACALLIVDLDHFKRINDSCGHAGGDEVLRRAAAVLRRSAPPTASLGRLGGEEFVVLLPTTSLTEALELAERVRAGIEGMDLVGSGLDGRVTTSVGVSLSAPGDDLSRLLGRADHALYAAKAAGRNRVMQRLAGDDGGSARHPDPDRVGSTIPTATGTP